MASLRKGLVRRVSGFGSVVGGRRAHRFEEGSTILEGSDISLVGVDSDATHLTQCLDVFIPAGSQEIRDGIGPEGGPDVAPSRICGWPGGSEGICGRIGRTHDLDVEALEQGSRSEFGRSELRLDLVIDPLGCLSGQFLLDAKHDMQFVSQPGARGSATKEVKVIGKDLPDFAVILLNGPPSFRGTPRSSRGIPCE